MPSLQNYDENGLIKSNTSQNERVTTFDSFMQGLDDEYDKRKELKSKPPVRKSAESKKTTPPPRPALPAAPLTLEGPIVYRDHQEKKKKKKQSPVKETKRPVVVPSSSDDEDSSQMVYDEDEAWFESDEEEKRRVTNEEENDNYEPKRKKTRISAKDDGDDRQYFSRLKEFYANKKPPSHSKETEAEEMEIGQGLWMPLSIWNRLFK